MGRTPIQCSSEFGIRAQYLHSWPITALDSPWRGRPRSWRRRRVCCPRVRSVYTWRTCPAAWRGHTLATPGRSPTAAQPEHRSQNHNIARQDFNATWTKLTSPYNVGQLVCTTVCTTHYRLIKHYKSLINQYKGFLKHYKALWVWR